MSWIAINAASYKFANLHQGAYALSLGGHATATNVGVVTNG